MPAKSDNWLVDLARANFLREIAAAGGQILLYTERMLHAKVMLVDDVLATISSANMDIRSLFLNYEAVMLMYSPADIQAVQQWMANVQIGCREMAQQVGPLREIAEGAVRLLDPLL